MEVVSRFWLVIVQDMYSNWFGLGYFAYCFGFGILFFVASFAFGFLCGFLFFVLIFVWVFGFLSSCFALATLNSLGSQD